MIARESNSAILFRHWLRAHPFITSAIETKDTRGKNYLNFSEVSEAQIRFGLAIKSDKGVLIRVVATTEGVPDYIYLRMAPSFIVIKYPKKFEIIDIETFVLERKRSKAKSLTAARAYEISAYTVKL